MGVGWLTALGEQGHPSCSTANFLCPSDPSPSCCCLRLKFCIRSIYTYVSLLGDWQQVPRDAYDFNPWYQVSLEPPQLVLWLDDHFHVKQEEWEKYALHSKGMSFIAKAHAGDTHTHQIFKKSDVLFQHSQLPYLKHYKRAPNLTVLKMMKQTQHFNIKPTHRLFPRFSFYVYFWCPAPTFIY